MVFFSVLNQVIPSSYFNHEIYLVEKAIEESSHLSNNRPLYRRPRWRKFEFHRRYNTVKVLLSLFISFDFTVTRPSVEISWKRELELERPNYCCDSKSFTSSERELTWSISNEHRVLCLLRVYHLLRPHLFRWASNNPSYNHQLLGVYKVLTQDSIALINKFSSGALCSEKAAFCCSMLFIHSLTISWKRERCVEWKRRLTKIVSSLYINRERG